VRLSLRRMMALVALAAVATWLGGAAVRVMDDRRYGSILHHRHRPGECCGFVLFEPAPFWPRYWRRLLGQPWPGSYACDCDD
jgi:hypothetical protein